MTEIVFIVTLTPSEDFEPTQAEEGEIALGILGALKFEVESGFGLMPEDRAWTKHIKVVSQCGQVREGELG